MGAGTVGSRGGATSLGGGAGGRFNSASGSIMSAMASPAAAASDVQLGPSLETLRDPSEPPPGSRISISACHVPASFETDASTKVWLGSVNGLPPSRRTTSA